MQHPQERNPMFESDGVGATGKGLALGSIFLRRAGSCACAICVQCANSALVKQHSAMRFLCRSRYSTASLRHTTTSKQTAKLPSLLTSLAMLVRLMSCHIFANIQVQAGLCGRVEHTSACVSIRQHTYGVYPIYLSSYSCIGKYGGDNVAKTQLRLRGGGGSRSGGGVLDVLPSFLARPPRDAMSLGRRRLNMQVVYVSILKLCCIRQHTYAYVSIRQHTLGGRRLNMQVLCVCMCVF
jgi:hypothetical protein